jgi:hypothetical protein
MSISIYLLFRMALMLQKAASLNFPWPSRWRLFGTGVAQALQARRGLRDELPPKRHGQLSVFFPFLLC